ncbi:hypothetical protein PPAR_a3725 [Pseudoalteromonas paragorgicola KMM 3548]|nr:hypothetical protein [Pseudoalteromonas distincta KMM 3548]
MYLESLDNLGEPFQFHHTLRHHVFSFQAHVKRFAIFDQFPYTHHIESGVFLQRK